MSDAALPRRIIAIGGIALALFAFNTAENLPIGLLDLMSDDLGVPLAAIGLLVSSSAIVVAIASLPLAYGSGQFPRRYVLTGVIAILAASTWISAATDSYAVLLGARLAGALAQALFFAVLAPAAVALFSPQVRGRVVGFVFASGSFATVAGVPAGTWLGHLDSWRTSFYALSAVSVVALLAVAACVPTTRPGESHADTGVEPDAKRYRLVLLTTAISATGAFTAFTYVAPFLREVTQLGAGAVSALLTLFGIGGLVGVLLVGALSDRLPSAVVAVPVAGQFVALAGLWLAGEIPWASALGVLALGLTAAPVFAATSARVLHLAPGRTDVASAANSAAFNAGLAAGGAVGGLVVALSSVRTAFAVGTIVSGIAAAVAVSGRRRARIQPA